MTAAAVLFTILTLLVVGGAIEAMRHRRRLDQIPVRIHVNGTRGKSSVTRLIAAGLRAGGIRTCAKTTGTLPRMILPDGSEYPVFRPSRANVIEQLRIVDTAVDFQAETLVLECMALIPYLQWLSEAKLVRATHAVITNARADHLEVMGPTEFDVAAALAGMVPVKGKLFTAEQRQLEVFSHAAKDRGTELVPIGEDEIEKITPLDMAGFRYLEHAENVALALRVCEDLGVARATPLAGMWTTPPDPGAMFAYEMDFFGREINFVNGFAANDPESTERIWRMALERYPDVEKRIAIFNCRVDRPDRSQQLGRSVADWPAADHYVLIGGGTYIFARAAAKAGIAPLKMVFAEERTIESIFEIIVELSGKSSLAMGMANIGGIGLDVVRYFANRSSLKSLK
ncbi:MAG: poly-gamma-glutamate synthase PgsB [Pirellulales bacterium]